MTESEEYLGFEYMEGVKAIINDSPSYERVRADFEAFYRSKEEDISLSQVKPDPETVYAFFSIAGDTARSYGLSERESEQVFNEIRNSLNSNRSRSALALEMLNPFSFGENTVEGVPESELYSEFFSK